LVTQTRLQEYNNGRDISRLSPNTADYTLLFIVHNYMVLYNSRKHHGPRKTTKQSTL